MAWTCNACKLDVALDTQGCPQCGALKDSWTILTDETRAFSIGIKRWEAWRGVSETPLAADDPKLATMPLAEPTEAVALPKATVAALAEKGQVPAPRHQLVLRVFPRGDKAPVSAVTVLFSQRAAEDHEVTTTDPALTEGRFDLRYALVFGAGDAPTLAGVQVIDITDADAPEGFAPRVQVAGLKKKPRELPVKAAAKRKFVFSR